MNIKKENLIRKKIIQKLLLIINKLDNSGNAIIEKNGELNFINSIIKYYKNQHITIFDVGANVGNYSKLLSKKADSKIHLFEPQKSCLQALKNKFGKNKNIITNNFALSDTNENGLIYYNRGGSGLASLQKRNLDFYNIKMDKSEKIQLRRADEYIANNAIQKIHLLKIDVEGHEIKTLEGFGKFLNPNFIDFIQFEYGGANIDSRTNLLSKKGFKICKIMKNHIEKRDYSPRMENFVYQNYIAVSKNLIQTL